MEATNVFLNGEVITVDEKNSTKQAVAIAGNKIIAVGSNSEIEEFIGPATKVLDLEGKSLIPGLIDAHLHFVMYGVFQLQVSCKDPTIETIENLLEALRVKAKKTPKGNWIRGWGFNEKKIKEQRYPTLEELDSISREHPISITRTCGHIGVVNSLALKIAKIDEHTLNPQGGIIERDSLGKLNGRLIETAYMQFNDIAGYASDELEQGMQIAQQHFIEKGITSIHEAGTFNQESFRLLQLASNRRAIKIRIYAMISTLSDCTQFTINMLKTGVVTGTGNDFFKIGPAKMFTDGSSTGPTIATREGYTSDPNYSGILYYSEDEIYEVLGEAHKRGYQITVHAQGDKAIEIYLNVVERALKEHPRENHRHRIEHAGISTPDLQKRIKDLHMIPVPNPPFPYEFGESYLQNYGERTNYMYPARNFIDQGIICAVGSDAPITTYNPFIGIHTAVNREVNSGAPFGQRQSISTYEAIRLYTYNAAYASFDEHLKGSIEVGKVADLAILDRGILTTEKRFLKDTKVNMTMIDGEIVYQRSNSFV
ncbi:amidohydrolase [Peribacillus sp. NPDC097675]|uniref:amidohydrolase n=1 Tax=Peribacillus sp. NPDC097675 TaxID=3390618 RepID=UPI003D0297EE